MSINVSPRQLSQPELVEEVRQALAQVAFPPRCLKIEITESLFVRDDAAVARLRELRDMGVQVCIDDFGTGYSSLSYLQRLPVDSLKIDRSFVQKLQSDERTVEMVKTIIQLAAELELEVIAEGVERHHELATLRSLSCAYMQGFSFSKPLDERSVLPLLRRNLQLAQEC